MSLARSEAWVFSPFALRPGDVFLRGTPSGLVPQCSARGPVLSRAHGAPGVCVPRAIIFLVTAPSPSLQILCIDPQTLVGDALHKILIGAGYQVSRIHDLSGIRVAHRLELVITEHHVPPETAWDILATLGKQGYRGRVIVHSATLTPAERIQYSGRTGTTVVENKDDAARLLAIIKALHGEVP